MEVLSVYKQYKAGKLSDSQKKQPKMTENSVKNLVNSKICDKIETKAVSILLTAK